MIHDTRQQLVRINAKKVKVMESNSRNQKIYYICELSKIADSKRKAEEEIINTYTRGAKMNPCMFVVYPPDNYQVVK